MFKDTVPPRRHHAAFLEEIALFVRSRAAELTSRDLECWRPSFPTPLMQAYLCTLFVRQDQFAEWHSNLAAGYVGLPGSDNAPRQTAALFNHLVGALHQRWRHFDANHFRCLQINDRCEFRRLLDRKISGFRALENLVYENRSVTPHIAKIDPVRQEAPNGSGKSSESPECGRVSAYGDGVSAYVQCIISNPSYG
jgi:hypothetical protein